MFCIHCGAELAEEARFCQSCGCQIDNNEFVEKEQNKQDKYLFSEYILMIAAVVLGISCFCPYISVNAWLAEYNFSLVDDTIGILLIVAVILVVGFTLMKVNILKWLSCFAVFCIVGVAIYETFSDYSSYMEIESGFVLMILSTGAMFMSLIMGIAES